MSYYVYADIERTAYDGGSIFKEFNTKEEALKCRAEIAHITDNYNTLKELSQAVAEGEYTPAIIGTWEYRAELSAEDNAEEWVYTNYSELVTYHEECLRNVVNHLIIFDGELVEYN